MEITILLPEDSSKKGIGNLKTFIDKASIAGIKTEIKRATHVHGQMGVGDILNSIKTIISGPMPLSPVRDQNRDEAAEPIVELVKCLQKYANNYRTVISLSTAKGNFVVPHGSMNA